jgi:hypothetical protein
LNFAQIPEMEKGRVQLMESHPSVLEPESVSRGLGRRVAPFGERLDGTLLSRVLLLLAVLLPERFRVGCAFGDPIGGVLSREKRRTITKPNRAGKPAAVTPDVARQISRRGAMAAVLEWAETPGGAKHLAKNAKEPRNRRFFL